MGILDKIILLIIAFTKLRNLKVIKYRLLVERGAIIKSNLSFLGKGVLIRRFCNIEGDGTIIFSGVNMLSQGVSIGFSNQSNMYLGKGSYISSYVCIGCYNKITIGNNVMIGSGTHINDFSYRFDRVDIPIKEQGSLTAPIVIEDDVWIGANCSITKGVNIGSHTVIGANSVVTKDIPHYSVAVGVPCRVIRNRLDINL